VLIQLQEKKSLDIGERCGIDKLMQSRLHQGEVSTLEDCSLIVIVLFESLCSEDKDHEDAAYPPRVCFNLFGHLGIP